MSPVPVREGQKRPYFPYALMMVESMNGLIVGTELLSPLPNLESMWETVSVKVADMLLKAKLCPEEIMLSSTLMFNMLKELADELDISLEICDNLPNLETARDALITSFQENQMPF